MPIKTKCIEVTTTEEEGFREMSDMALQIEKLVSKYKAKYEVKYYFKQ